MTLCIAWIRQNGDEQELVMATDSRLTGGESWDSGVKLFELPRQDCLLCFAGGTERAYPLILNSISSIKFDKYLASSYTDIHNILEYLTELFTALVSEIKESADDIHEARGLAQFLFGGWSWKHQQFRIWRLYYEPTLSIFTHELVDPSSARVFKFLGDHIEEAQQLLVEKFGGLDKLLSSPLDMEPLQVLAEMSRSKHEFRPIGGALQVAKVYQSGTSEFFGVMWPSATGSPSFLGRPVPDHDLPSVRLIDPDTATLIEDSLPDCLNDIDEELYGNEYDFVVECYPAGEIKADLSEKKQKRLLKAIQAAAFKKYMLEHSTAEASHA